MREEKDQHINDAGDVYLRTVKGDFKSVIYLQLIPKFTLILSTKEQLEVLKQELEKGPVRLFLDATGNITRKLNNNNLLHHVLVLTIQRTNRPDLLFPVAEMITDCGNSANISFFLKTIREKVLTKLQIIHNNTLKFKHTNIFNYIIIHLNT